MEVELLVVPDCPGTDAARVLLRTALNDVGLASTPLTLRIIDTEAAARACKFVGSPAFVVDGADLFATGGIRGVLACRVYSTPEGLRNVPEPSDLRSALVRHLARTGRDRS